MDYLRGFSRFREDPEFWKKLGVGSVLYLSTACIPLVGQLVMSGWGAAIVRRASQGAEHPQPRLDFDMNLMIAQLKTGWRPMVAGMVWMLPGVLLLSVLWGALAVVMSMAASSSNGGEAVGMGLQCVMLCGMPLVMILVALLSLPAQIAMLRVELTQDFGYATSIGDVIAMTKLVLRELVFGTLIIGVAVSFAMSIATMLCYVPVFLVMVIAAAVRAHFAAQLYQLALQRGMAPLPIAQTEVEALDYPSAPAY